ncbi:MAG: branched-chain amino acid ABC transporter permease [Desulfobaccales bacterium]
MVNSESKMFHIPPNILLMQAIIGLALGAVFVLLASGLSMIYGLMDVVNFAHGVFFMLGAYAVYQFNLTLGNFWVGVALAVLAVALLGALTEISLLRPLYKTGNLLYPLLLTFGLALALPDVVKMFYGLMPMPVNYPEGLQGSLLVGPLIVPKYRLFVIVLTFSVMFSLWLFLKKSNLGMILRATTTDKGMVDAMGINVNRVVTLGFSIGIALAALGGAVAAPMVSVEPNMGVNIVLQCFVVTVVGGLGSLGGAVVSGVIIGEVVAFTSLFAGGYADVVIYFVMAVILLVRPRGLFGELSRE